jgi:hypothetical protein
VIPRLSQGLADLAAKLATAIAPETNSRFAMASTGMISMLLMALAQDAERAVANRMTDIEEMKALFEAATAAGATAEQASARAAFRARQPASLRLTDIDVLHAEGLRLLIDLHAWAEQHAPELDRQIWGFLLRHTERHRLDVAGP